MSKFFDQADWWAESDEPEKTEPIHVDYRRLAARITCGAIAMYLVSGMGWFEFRGFVCGAAVTYVAYRADKRFR